MADRQPAALVARLSPLAAADDADEPRRQVRGERGRVHHLRKDASSLGHCCCDSLCFLLARSRLARSYPFPPCCKCLLTAMRVRCRREGVSAAGATGCGGRPREPTRERVSQPPHGAPT